MNRDDVRMVERGDGPRLTFEAVAPFGIDVRVRDHLERHETTEPRIARLVDSPMPPRPRVETISYGPSRAPSENGIARPGRIIGLSEELSIADCRLRIVDGADELSMALHPGLLR